MYTRTSCRTTRGVIQTCSSLQERSIHVQPGRAGPSGHHERHAVYVQADEDSDYNGLDIRQHQDRLSTLYAQHLRQGPHAGQRGLPLRIQPQQPPSSTSHISFRSVFAEEDEYQRLSADEVLEDEAAMQRQVHAPQEHVDRAPQPSVATTQI